MTFSEIMAYEGFIPNDEQLPVIESDCNTVVSAGAGAGKTAVLSWRFLRLVMERGVRPDGILTLTFTRKAAGEMRERIFSRLVKAKDSLPPDTLKSFSEATISTLDSFCSQIVRSDCTRFGLPRDFSNLSEEDLLSTAERLSAKFISDPENMKEAEAIAALVMPARLMEGFFSLIASGVSMAGNYDSARIAERFHGTVRDVYLRRRELLEPMFESLSQMNMSPAFRADFDIILKDFREETFHENEDFNLKTTRDPEIKELVAEMRPLMGKGSGYATLQDIANDPVSVSPLQVAVEKFARMLNDEKRRMGELTFRDVSDLAVMILRDNTALREVFRKKFRYIMIDEFQDNNASQRELLFLLSERDDVRPKAGTVPTVKDLDAHKLFFVGDEKQSIYRFRGADVSVFRNLQKEVGENGASLTLSSNYRSQSLLIDHFNSVFSRVLVPAGETDADYEACYNPIRAGRPADGTESKIILSVFNREAIKDPDLDSGTLEAEAVASYCRRMLETDEFLCGGKRPEPEDIAILFRSSGNQMNIEKALKRYGIPYQTTETRSLMIDAVSSDFYSFINCILHPDDTRSRAALLKSPFCGMCEENIEKVLNGDIEGISRTDRERYRAFSSFFEETRKEAFRLTLPELLQKLYMQGGYKAYLDSDESRRVFREHYEYLFSYAVDHEAAGDGLADYAAFIRDNLGSGGKLPETAVLTKERSGVQLMTVHKSKGLEFKAVIFTGTGGRTRGDESRYVFEYGGDLISSENKAVRKILEEDANLKEDAELKRLMYVAFTRAEDHLVVTGSFKFNKDGSPSCGDVLKWYMSAVGADLQTMTCSDPAVTLEVVTGLEPQRAFRSHAGRAFGTGRAFPVFNTKASRVGVTSHDYEEEIPLQGERLPVYDSDAITGPSEMQSRFGTLCHEVLEKRLKYGSYDSVECSICSSAKDNAVLLQRARAFADGFVSSGFFEKRVKGHRTEEEMRFYTYDDRDPAVAVEGVMDLLVYGDDFNLVVDYKTDMFRNPEVHKDQLLTYIRVAEEICGKKCLGVLYYLRDGSTGPVWDREGKEV